MTLTILLIDQLLFRPMVVWAEKFRYEQTAAQAVSKSVVYDLFDRARDVKALFAPVGRSRGPGAAHASSEGPAHSGGAYQQSPA